MPGAKARDFSFLSRPVKLREAAVSAVFLFVPIMLLFISLLVALSGQSYRARAYPLLRQQQPLVDTDAEWFDRE